MTNNPGYNAVRQISTELIASQNIHNKGKHTRKKQKNCSFEMRFFDKERRFKWSPTEMSYSTETFSIVKQYQKVDRVLYIQEYPVGTKFELVDRKVII